MAKGRATGEAPATNIKIKGGRGGKGGKGGGKVAQFPAVTVN